MNRITEEELIKNFSDHGICPGDTILVRANLGAIGRIIGGADTFIRALLKTVGEEGTIISLAFTSSRFIKKPKIEDAFDVRKKSYAGALPNTMLDYVGAHRSTHPTCSYVAIGKHAEFLTKKHNETSPAYEPIREIINLNGKCMLIGCVDNSPGFTTTHLAEIDLNLSSLIIFPQLHSTYCKLPNGDIKLIRRKDLGLCSNSYYKFYSLYVRHGILRTGNVGNAYSIIAMAKECYKIDLETLKENSKFNICQCNLCFTCNAGRWDRLHYAPLYFIRLLLKSLKDRQVKK
jgi:aminoglycoside N3'-acetyltransferase